MASDIGTLARDGGTILGSDLKPLVFHPLI
jgi:hypothetical protein